MTVPSCFQVCIADNCIVPWRINNTTFCKTTPLSLDLVYSVKTQGLLSNWKSPWQGKSTLAHPLIPSVHERHYHEVTPIPHMEATWPQKFLLLALSSAIFHHGFPQWAALRVGFVIQNNMPRGGPFACKVASPCILKKTLTWCRSHFNRIAARTLIPSHIAQLSCRSFCIM